MQRDDDEYESEEEAQELENSDSLTGNSKKSKQRLKTISHDSEGEEEEDLYDEEEDNSEFMTRTNDLDSR